MEEGVDGVEMVSFGEFRDCYGESDSVEVGERSQGGGAANFEDAIRVLLRL